MSQTSLYPLRFEPIYQYRLWGSIGEEWALSDREDHPIRVANGPLKGQTVGQLMEEHPVEMPGDLAQHFRRFPLLLKFPDAREMLSVQVHPSAGESAKTEAWAALKAGPERRIYAGQRPGVTETGRRQAIENGGFADQLAYNTPQPGDAVFLPPQGGADPPEGKV